MVDPADLGGKGDDATSRHVSTFHLEAMRLGGMTRPARDRAARHLVACARCRQLAAEWEAGLREFADGALARTRGSLRDRAEAVQRAAPQRPLLRRVPGWAAALATAAALAGLCLVWRAQTSHEGVAGHPGAPGATREPAVGVKGGLDFAIAARRGDRVFHADAQPLRAGDRIRFVLDGVSSSYLMVGSVDGAGHANIYVPYEGARSVLVASRPPASGHLEIEGSIVLDRAPGPERVFALVSQRPLAVGPVRRALLAIGAAGPTAIRETRTLGLPPELVASAGTLIQRSVIFEKGRE
jgi:hypothetical protein